MKFLKQTAIAVCILFVLLACNIGTSNEKIKSDETSLAPLQEKENKTIGLDKQIADSTQTPPQKQQTQPGVKSIQQPSIDWDKKIIKNATLNVEVKNYQSYSGLVHGNIKRFAAYVAQEEQNQTDDKIENTITIKVPVEQFDDLVAAITSGEQKIIEKKITSEDVTTQVVDTRSRMEA